MYRLHPQRATRAEAAMATPIERLSNLVVGTVESVSPDEVRVLLELEAPHATALNTGTPAAFPRLNGYVLIPNEAGATVAYIAWIGIERSPYPKRTGFQDFGLIDLPFPMRKMSVSPVGTLTSRRDRASGAIAARSRIRRHQVRAGTRCCSLPVCRRPSLVTNTRAGWGDCRT